MEVNIIKIQEISVFTAAGILKAQIQVSFNVGEHGPFTILIPKEEFDNTRATREIEKIKREVEAVSKRE
ncbi:MAG TPA: hypothetical protein VI935_01185 [Thermodesulfobacteriota bacterium]|nr:hypothetical protein [Thermodesulfobacteriota bacterium]